MKNVKTWDSDPPELKRLYEVFFAGMLEYLTFNRPVHYFHCTEDEWLFEIDKKLTALNGEIMTRDVIEISHRKEPQWQMRATGRYQSEEALTYVHAALKEAFKRSEFYGGRGPGRLRFTKKHLLYRNRSGSPVPEWKHYMRGWDVLLDTRSALDTRPPDERAGNPSIPGSREQHMNVLARFEYESMLLV